LQAKAKSEREAQSQSKLLNLKSLDIDLLLPYKAKHGLLQEKEKKKR
jgi:hypothetical protein